MQAIHHPTHRRIWSFVLLGTATLLLIVGQTEPVLAHANDRALQGENIAAGPYLLTVWTAPARLRTGEIHVETMVFDREGNPDRKCAVYVTLTPLGSALPALNVLSVPLSGVMEGVRQAAFHITQPGRYQVEAAVVDGTGEGGRAIFEVEIIQVPAVVHVLIYLLMAGSIVVGIWMLRRGITLWFGDAQSG